MRIGIVRYAVSFLLFLAVTLVEARVEAGGNTPASEAQTVDVIDRVTGEGYRIFLHIPSGPAPEEGFPVVYLLDGSWYFEMSTQISKLLVRSGDMPSAVIVGIGYDDPNEARILRWQDFTRPNDHPLPERLRSQGLKTGGYDRFARFVSQDLPAEVSRQVKVRSDCDLLIGHSLSGLFALQLMLDKPDTFRAFAIGDPSVWYDNENAIDRVLRSVESRSGLPRHLYVARSGINNPAFQSQIDLAAAALATVDTEDGEMIREVYEHDSHNSMIPGFISTAMRTGLNCE